MTFQRKNRVLVIGLDGATFDLIEPLLAVGKLPNLAGVLSRGLHSKLYSTILPLSPTAWTSFSSGKNAGKHGIYDFSKRSEGSYDSIPTTSLDNKVETLWDILGNYNSKSIVVNVPLTYPPRPVNGVLISGFPTPTSRGDYTYPKALLPELKEKFGNIHIHKPTVLYSKGKEQMITDAVQAATHQQTEITAYLMKKLDWSLTVSVFDATDVLGHYFWAYLDPNHPKYDPKLAEPVRKMVEDIHVELDKAIGELMALAGEDSLRFVISDHGFGPVYYGVYVNNWLLDQGYMHFKTTPKVKVKYWAYRHGLHTYNLLRIAEKLSLVKSIESAYAQKSFLASLMKNASLSFDDIDWSRTSVYSMGNLGQLFVNIKGREPQGCVLPQDARPLIEELKVKLAKLEDPSTHRRMFDQIYSRWDVFSGDAGKVAPDIVFFDEEMKYSAHRMFELGSNKLVSPHPIYSGNHKMDGILFVEGKGVKRDPGSKEIRPNLIDLATTRLHFLGSRIPNDMDGRILQEIFEDGSDFHSRRIEYQSEAGDALRIQKTAKNIQWVKSL
jgi:predicted AlkP superfamily phosphohydrolase/phosphomutase